MAINFDPTFGLGKRGAYGDLPPIIGSSNLSKAIPMAGRFGAVLQPGNNPFPAPTATPGVTPPGGSDFIMPEGLSKEAQAEYVRGKLNADTLYGMLNYMNDPGRQKQQLDNALAFYKEQSKEQMNNRMVNEIIANIGSGARAAVSRYSDPAALAASYGTIGDAYSRASANTAHLAQLGAGQPSRQYFTS